jgi:hypothetical protein
MLIAPASDALGPARDEQWARYADLSLIALDLAGPAERALVCLPVEPGLR